MAKGRHLHLDWDALLSDRHDSPIPLEVDVFASSVADNDHELQQGIGACHRDTEPKPGESSEEVGSNVTPTESNSQGNFEDKTDDAFSEELGFMCLDNCKSSRENGLQLKAERRRPLQKSQYLARVSSREPPSVRYPKKDKQRALSCKFADFILPDISSSRTWKTLRRRFSKRRGAAEHQSSMNLEFEEVQHVVLLDDEDIQPIHSIEGGNSSDDGMEYKIYYPSRDDPECVELSYSDLNCLQDDSYLSSPIMNFYIQYLQRSPSHTAKLKGDCYVFNTYFYSKLEEAMTCKDDKAASFMKLRRWWKGVDIFLKAYIFLPIHADMHWSLVIICIPANEDEPELIILHLDSLGLHTSSHIFSIVARYLVEEWNCANHIDLPQDLPASRRSWKYFPWRIEKEKITVPQQKNEYDCGLFVLYFMQRFIEEAPERLRKQDLFMVRFGKKWFHPDEASELRSKVRDLLTDEFESSMLEFGIQESRRYCS